MGSRAQTSAQRRADEASEKLLQLGRVSSTEQLYLSPDVSQRLVLSLRCGIPTEMDWALERLVQTSAVEPGFLTATYLPSLAYDLINVMADAVDMLESAVRDRQMLPRGIEAAIVLRNICLDSQEHRVAAGRAPKLPGVIARVLANGMPDAMAISEGQVSMKPMPVPEHAEEYKLVVLELLDCLVSVQPIVVVLKPPIAGQPALPSDPARAICPLLVRHIVGSPDRAMIMVSFRILSAVYTTARVAEPLLNHPNAMQAAERAAELLLILDLELTQLATDHLYLFTSLPDNAMRLAADRDLIHLIRTLLSTVTRCSTRETLEADVAPHPDFARPDTEPAPAQSVERLYEDEWQDLLDLELPTDDAGRLAFAHAWLRTVYERVDGTEMLQAELDRAYMEEFTSRPDAVRYFMPSSQVLLKVANVFENVWTEVEDDAPEDEKQFFIANLRPRDRPATRLIKCRVRDCDGFQTIESTELYRHLVREHIPPNLRQCPWRRCQFSIPSSIADPYQDWQVHCRSHAQPLPETRPQPPQPDRDVVRWDMFTSSVDPTSKAPNGPALLAILTIRNIAFAVKQAFLTRKISEEEAEAAKANGTLEKGSSILDYLVGGLTVMPTAAARPEINSSLDEETRATAYENGFGALQSVETRLIEMVFSHRTLSEYASDILGVLTACRAKTRTEPFAM